MNHRNATALLDYLALNFSHFLRRKCRLICSCHGLSRQDAEDLYQDTLCRIGMKVPAKRPPLDSVEEWERFLSRIANNLVLNAIRSAARRKVRDAQYAHENAARKQAIAANEPESRHFSNDIDHILEEQCDERMRQVFRRWSEGWSPMQIAKEMRLSKSTVTRSLYRTLAILRLSLQRSGW